ncbi:MAG: DUF1653 domain-containing protein [Mycobacteriales bacterium]
MSLPELQAGVWRHWKGNDYLVLGLGHDAADPSRAVVVYVPLYDVPGPRLAVRTAERFLEEVSPGVPRFRYRGPG